MSIKEIMNELGIDISDISEDFYDIHEACEITMYEENEGAGEYGIK